MKKAIRWSEDSDEAERHHGPERDAALGNLGAHHPERWVDNLPKLARAAWESGFDSGVGASNEEEGSP